MPPDRKGPFGLLVAQPSKRRSESHLHGCVGSSDSALQTRCVPLASTARRAFCTKGKGKPPAGRASIMISQSPGLLRRPPIFPIQPCPALGSHRPSPPPLPPSSNPPALCLFPTPPDPGFHYRCRIVSPVRIRPYDPPDVPLAKWTAVSCPMRSRRAPDRSPEGPRRRRPKGRTSR